MQGTESLRHCGNLCPGIGRLIYTRFIAEFPCIRLEVGVEHKARYGGQFLCILHQILLRKLWEHGGSYFIIRFSTINRMMVESIYPTSAAPPQIT